VPNWPVKVAEVAVVCAKNGVNAPPSSETKIAYEAMLVAPVPGDPLQLTLKLVVVATAGNGFTVLVGGATT
jgi:hypothetical protein